jgi:hypothetical protein
MIAPFNTDKSLTVLKKHFRRISASSGVGYRFPAEVPDQNESFASLGSLDTGRL